jgi:hypothetical protein
MVNGSTCFPARILERAITGDAMEFESSADM